MDIENEKKKLEALRRRELKKEIKEIINDHDHK